MLQATASAGPFSILAVEYPGYGLLLGCPSEASVKGVAERLIQFIFETASERFRADQIILMGQSIGSGVAMHAVQRMHDVFGGCRCGCPAAVILKSGYTSIKSILDYNQSDALELLKLAQDIGNHEEEAFANGILETSRANIGHQPCLMEYGRHIICDRFRSLLTLTQCPYFFSPHRCPVLLLHGTHDNVIPYQHSQCLWHAHHLRCIRAENLRPLCKDDSNVHLVPVRGAGHNNIFGSVEIRRFVERCVVARSKEEGGEDVPVCDLILRRGLVSREAAATAHARHALAIWWRRRAVLALLALVALILLSMCVVMPCVYCRDLDVAEIAFSNNRTTVTHRKDNSVQPLVIWSGVEGGTLSILVALLSCAPSRLEMAKRTRIVAVVVSSALVHTWLFAMACVVAPCLLARYHPPARASWFCATGIPVIVFSVCVLHLLLFTMFLICNK